MLESSIASLIPFQDFLLPFVSDAKQALLQRVPRAILSDAHALAPAEAHLLRALSEISAQSLLLEFWLFRSRRGYFDIAREESPVVGEYAEFVAACGRGEFARILAHYPELERLLRLTVEQWVTNMAELLARLHGDLELIEARFTSQEKLGEPVAIATGFSDRHCGGRTVACVTLACGTRIWYKPKPLEIDRAYNALLAWCNQDSGWMLKTLAVLPRQGYGWVENVGAVPCTSAKDVHGFFVKAGILLSIMYLLRGADFHSENVVACGGDPVVIDLEMLLQPRRRVQYAEHVTESVLMSGEDHTVLSTGYLPRGVTIGGRAYDISGLGAKGGVATPIRGIQWSKVNTDDMKMVFVNATLEEGNHLPLFQERRVAANEHIEKIVQGFERGYCRFMEQKNLLLDHEGPLAWFRNQPVRYLHRPSVAYGSALRAAYNPRNLIDRSERRSLLTSLVLDPEDDTGVPGSSTLAHAELQALEQNDIPIFHASSSGVDLLTSCGTVQEFFAEPSLASVLCRVRELNESDLAKQVELLKAALRL